jgi:class 3 adenylate cyclase
MPLYIDIHELNGVKADDVAKAHALDLEKQGAHRVNFIKYWVNETGGKVFCLVDAPSEDAANCVHREAHGLVPCRMIEVQPELAEGFIGGGPVNAGGAVTLPGSPALDTGTRTILFTDIVGSTKLTEELGADGFLPLLETHNEVVRSALKAAFGREVKPTGDGLMASFVSATSAVQCAMRVLKDLAASPHNAKRQVLRVRIGAASGEPVERHGDFFGSAVNLAARLCAHADPSQALVCAATAGACDDQSLRFRDLGEVSLKGFDRPVRAHAALG